MNGVYRSLKGKVQDTFQLGKTNSMPPLREANGNSLSLTDEMEKLEKVVAERISRLREAVNQGEAVLAGEARQAEQVIGSLKATIAGLENKLKETEETLRKKDSSRQQIEETLKANVHELQNDVKKRDEALTARAKEIDELKSNLDGKVKQVSELESVSETAKQEAAGHAQRADELGAVSREKISALEAQLEHKEGLARQKESTIKDLEQKLAFKIQDFESLMKDKQQLLAGRDAVISDLKSQLKLLTKGIGEMSSFFNQAQAFAVIERQEVSSSFASAPVNAREEKLAIQANGTKVTALAQEKKAAAVRSNGASAIPSLEEEKPAAVQSTGVKVTPVAQEHKPVAIAPNGAEVTEVISDATPEILSPEVFERMASELAEVAGVMNPLATLIVREHVEGLGESVEKFPKTRLPELLDSLAREILNESRQIDFRKRLAQTQE